MGTNELMQITQIVKTSLVIILFVVLLAYILKKLSGAFRKGITEPMNFDSVSTLLSLGLTVYFLSEEADAIFKSIFSLFINSIDSISMMLVKEQDYTDVSRSLTNNFVQFRFTDLILFFAVWLFIRTLLKVFFQSPDASDTKKIFSDKLFTKNTFVVLLLFLSIYLCIASIVAIPEFQALESSEFNNDELTEFTKEVERSSVNTKEELMIKELTTEGLKKNENIEKYEELNQRILNYNQMVSIFYNEYERKKNNTIDAYKSAILEKTATKERIKYRTQLKEWLQIYSSTFTLFVYYKPKMESALGSMKSEIARSEKDSLMRNQNSIDSLNHAWTNSLMQWDTQVLNLGDLAFNIKNIDYGIPEKPQIGEKYGIFKSISGWLLNTESMSLALIVGLFAFGLLGSIGSTFIRQRIKAGSDSEIKDFIPNLPAVLINGISSAIVVFLAVKGTLVIFSGKDSALNPYVLFFTCLVAAVFSEDVWKWAQQKLNSQLNNGSGTGSGESVKKNELEQGGEG